MKTENRFSKDRFNSLKRDTLEIFRVYGPLNPPAWARLAKFSPIRASYSYLLRLHRFGLLNRTSNPSGLVYSLSDRGRARLEWLSLPDRPKLAQCRPEEPSGAV
jgi:hypothetical protein